MRRAWLLILALSALSAGAAFPTVAESRSAFSMLTAPLRAVTGLAFHSRVGHRRARARQVARSHDSSPQRAAARETESRPTPTLPQAFWPVGYTDLFGFTFATSKDDRFWVHGANDLFAAVLAPAALRQQSVASRRASAETDDNATSNECGNDKNARADAQT